MFWGTQLKNGAPYKLTDHSASSLLHVSNVALGGTADAGKTSVWVTSEGKKILLTNLESGKHEQVSLDLYFRAEQNVEFSSSGKGDVYLSGYYEPETEGEDFEGSDEELEEALGKEFKALAPGKKAHKHAEADSSEEDVKAHAHKTQAKPVQPPQKGQSPKVQALTAPKPVAVHQSPKVQAQTAPKGQPPAQKPGKQAQPPKKAKEESEGSDEIDEDEEGLDEEIDLEDSDEDMDDLELGAGDSDSEEETKLGKRKHHANGGAGDVIKKTQKTNAGIPHVKSELKGHEQHGTPQHKKEHHGGEHHGSGDKFQRHEGGGHHEGGHRGGDRGGFRGHRGGGRGGRGGGRGGGFHGGRGGSPGGHSGGGRGFSRGRGGFRGRGGH